MYVKGLRALWNCVSTPCQKAQCIQSYGLWMCPDKRITDVLVLSRLFSNVVWTSWFSVTPSSSGGWSAGNERPDASRSTRACGRDCGGWSGIMDKCQPRNHIPLRCIVGCRYHFSRHLSLFGEPPQLINQGLSIRVLTLYWFWVKNLLPD